MTSKTLNDLNITVYQASNLVLRHITVFDPGDQTRITTKPWREPLPLPPRKS